ncbi:MAG: NAD(+)--rifampin ADP-ribosyltransferase [Dermatophilaceae bacterium]
MTNPGPTRSSGLWGFPGDPTHSFRSRQPLRVLGELVDWVGHSSENRGPCETDSMRCSGTAGSRSRTGWTVRSHPRAERTPPLEAAGRVGPG